MDFSAWGTPAGLAILFIGIGVILFGIAALVRAVRETDKEDS